MNAHRWTTLLATCWSVVTAGLGLWWTLQPSAFLLGGGDADGPPLAFEFGAAWLPVIGGLGAAVALGLRHRPRSTPLRLPLLVLAAGLTGLCLAASGHMPLLALAYALAFAGPPALIAALLSRAFRLGIKGTSAMVGTPVAAGLLFAAVIVVIKGAHWAMFAVVGSLIWAALTVTSYRVGNGRCATCGRPGAAWTSPESAARWGRKVTIMAALMPLPYGLARLTWFTPWPIAFPDGAGWGIWITGVLLGFASEGGAILTRGLIRPWGEVWPRWVPALHGRSIPVAGPTFAALTVSVMLVLLSVFVAVSAAKGELDPLGVVAFVPLALWGPLLAGAAMAYYYRRRDACTRCPEEPVNRPDAQPLPIRA
ncbi:hypothetical protein [Actinomadura sp. 7K507]|uniref:hypothetical protein n=1 Tax=Actinomadura sp. 7K507 TaxID=2530365 RepID=UPI00104827FF|nr:hypothetical protein [Actinomadura sp. 7K507]TDC79586.1 hypothetical protein E1285_35920 [Actinomadura sp. 7K507]